MAVLLSQDFHNSYKNRESLTNEQDISLCLTRKNIESCSFRKMKLLNFIKRPTSCEARKLCCHLGLASRQGTFSCRCPL